MIFEYRARNKSGELQTGTVEAVNKENAINILQRQFLVVIALEAQEEQKLYRKRIKFFDKVSKKDLSIFTKQLSTLFESSVPLVLSLHSLANQTKNYKLQNALLAIAANVEGGMTLSDALAEHTDIFSNFFTQIVKAGEASGALDEVLLYLSEYTERDYYVYSKIKGALTYPAFVLAVFILVAIGMFVFVLPNLLDIIIQSGAKLPAPTRAILFVSNLLRERWPILLLLLIAGGVGFWRFTKTDRGEEFLDRAELRLPIFGNVFRQIYVFRFAESLAMLIRGGVPINQSLEITASVIDNYIYKGIILDVKDKVTRGQSMSQTLEAHPEILTMVAQMIDVGEKTGKLEEMLQKVAEFYQKELFGKVENLVSLIEPVLIVVMGMGVGLLMAAILMPIYGSISSF